MNEENLRKEIMEAFDDPKTLLEPNINYIHSGNYALNWLLCGKFFGGWPVGSVNEAFGDPSTGKSLILLQAGAQIQKAGGIFFDDDTEDAHKDENLETLGVDTDPTMYRKVIPPSANIHDCFVRAATTVRKVAFRIPYVYAIDSISVISSKWSMTNNEYKEDQGRKAKEIRGGLDFLWNAIHETEENTGRKSSGIFLISRHSISNPKQYGKKSPKGGDAPGYYSTIRLLMEKPIQWPKDNPRGVMINVQVIKSRVCYGHEGAGGWFFVDWKTGVDQHSGILQILSMIGLAKDCKNGYFEVEGFDKSLSMQTISKEDNWSRMLELLQMLDSK